MIFASTAFAADLPPEPPGWKPALPAPRQASAITVMAAAVPAPVPAPIGLIQLHVVRYTPHISRLEFYCATNRPLRWRLERSLDLITWSRVEEFTGTNDPAPQIPILRDNARLVTHQLVAPSLTAMFYRLTVLP